MQKYDTTLPVSKGGTGISAVPASGNYLATTDGSGNWQAINQFESWKVFMGNSGATAMEAVSLKGSNGIVVSTETVDGNTSINIGLPQDLSEASTTAEFANVNISGDVLTTTLKAGAVKVPVEDGCTNGDAGVTGNMKFCKTRFRYYCEDNESYTDSDKKRNKLVFDGSGNPYCCCKTTFDGNTKKCDSGGSISSSLLYPHEDDHACSNNSAYLHEDTTQSFNQLVYYVDSTSKWSCTIILQISLPFSSMEEIVPI